jgi:hypothetical protein
MGVPSSSSFTRMICCSPVDISESLPSSDGKCCCIRDEGPWSGASYSRDEDHTEPALTIVVSVSVRLHPTNFGAIQHAFGSICYDTATRQPLAVTEGLPDTRSGGGPYEVGTICTSCWLVNVRYGRDAARHSACGWSRQQIHAQSRPPTLERSEAYLEIFGWHTRLRHQIRTQRTLRHNGLHRLGLRGLSRHPEIDVRILLQIGNRRHFVEVETTGLYGY